MKKRKMHGDVLRINITPAGDPPTFPWVKFFRHPYGIKHPAAPELGGVNATRDKSRSDLAREIGEAVISGSKVLSAWLSAENPRTEASSSRSVAEEAGKQSKTS
jgi:hypothetical protein